MKISCDVIRDLLPLYADDACSQDSRRMVDEHLNECADCSGILKRLQNNEIENDLQMEKQDVIEYGAKKFRKQSATVGSTVSGVFMIPILVCLIVNLTTGSAMGWFFIVLASLAVAASLVVVPIMAPRGNKAFWTFCAFSASLMILLAVTCLVTRGNWFWLVSSCVLFGLAVCFTAPNKKEFLEIVAAMAKEKGITLSDEELAAGAERFALAKGGRSPRCAKQYVESLYT